VTTISGINDIHRREAATCAYGNGGAAKIVLLEIKPGSTVPMLWQS